MSGGPELGAFWARSSAVAAGDGWLGPRERRVQAGLRFAKRRDDWSIIKVPPEIKPFNLAEFVVLVRGQQEAK